jgi:type IV pilus modification protein PilV
MIKLIKKQYGVSMIELMVSLFIFSVGLLGFATLQTRSLQEGFDSGQRSVVLWRTQELSDRIRANDGELTTYVAAVNNGAVCDATPTRCADYWDGGAVNATVCTATQMATFDVWDVLCNGEDATEDVLIDSDISLTCDDRDPGDAIACSGGSNLTLEACWTSRSATSDNQLEVIQGTAALPSCTDPSAPSYLFEFYTLEFVP